MSVTWKPQQITMYLGSLTKGLCTWSNPLYSDSPFSILTYFYMKVTHQPVRTWVNLFLPDELHEFGWIRVAFGFDGESPPSSPHIVSARCHTPTKTHADFLKNCHKQRNFLVLVCFLSMYSLLSEFTKWNDEKHVKRTAYWIQTRSFRKKTAV